MALKPEKSGQNKKPAKNGEPLSLDFLKVLIEAHGPSGNESRVRSVIEKEIRPYVDDIYVDKLGNLVTHKKGRGEKVMVAAHMDEIGLMVKQIDKNGHIKFATIGGIEPITLVGQTVRVYQKNDQFACIGVITFAELHEDHEIEGMPKLDELYIDTGLGRDELHKKGIEIGCYAIARHHFKRLGNNEIISGKALDDRIGCFILVEVAKRLKKNHPDIYFVFTAQEEIGLYGAQVSTSQLEPDWGMAVDTINAEDSDEFESSGVVIGKGPSIILMDAEIITNKKVNDWIVGIAKKHKIPIQLRVEEVGTTDATKIFLATKKGIPATTIAVPVRNLHSTVGIAHVNDISSTIRLLLELFQQKTQFSLV